MIHRNTILIEYKKIGITLGSAMEAIQPEWNDDVYDWRCTIPDHIPKTFDR